MSQRTEKRSKERSSSSMLATVYHTHRMTWIKWRSPSQTTITSGTANKICDNKAKHYISLWDKKKVIIYLRAVFFWFYYVSIFELSSEFSVHIYFFKLFIVILILSIEFRVFTIVFTSLIGEYIFIVTLSEHMRLYIDIKLLLFKIFFSL